MIEQLHPSQIEPYREFAAKYPELGNPVKSFTLMSLAEHYAGSNTEAAHSIQTMIIDESIKLYLPGQESRFTVYTQGNYVYWLSYDNRILGISIPWLSRMVRFFLRSKPVIISEQVKDHIPPEERGSFRSE